MFQLRNIHGFKRDASLRGWFARAECGHRGVLRQRLLLRCNIGNITKFMQIERFCRSQ
jgi:hypothetical protein